MRTTLFLIPIITFLACNKSNDVTTVDLIENTEWYYESSNNFNLRIEFADANTTFSQTLLNSQCGSDLELLETGTYRVVEDKDEIILLSDGFATVYDIISISKARFEVTQQDDSQNNFILRPDCN